MADDRQTTHLAQNIGRTIRARRDELGWSQAWLAHRAGIAQQTLSDYERGRRSPSLEMLGYLSQALEVAFTIGPAQLAGSTECA